MENVNQVVITGNLTRDPELRHTGSGTAVCDMRIAVNARRKQGEEWVDKPNYFNVTSFGARAESHAEHLSKGRPVAIVGRLDWSEWETKEGGKRQAVQILADQVQFLGGKKNNGETDGEAEAEKSTAPAGAGNGASGSAEDDIPF
jgi:single-strand DNA-binding protein